MKKFKFKKLILTFCIFLILGLVANIFLIDQNKTTSFIDVPQKNNYPNSPIENSYFNAATCISEVGVSAPRSPQLVVAGHAYGSHEGTNSGIYGPLLLELQKISTDFDYLALTGDISRSGDFESFKEVELEVKNWKKVFIAPGNHDVGTQYARSNFEKVFGKTYGSEPLGDALLIYLDTNLNDSWEISGEQLDWLKETISNSNQRSIVVLTHHLIWSKGDGSDFPINGGPATQGHDPDQLFNLFSNLGKKVLIISGDTGAFKEQPSITCVRKGNVSFVASGVGGGVQDSLLIIEMSKDPKVYLHRF